MRYYVNRNVSGNRMKTTANILILLIMTLLLACGQTANQDKKVHIESDSLQTIETKKELTKEEKHKQIEEENRLDSLRLNIALDDAFKIAKTAFKTDNFTKEYELKPDDSSYAIKIDIIIGGLFKDSQKYFLLRRHVPWATYLDLYKIVDDRAKSLIEREQGSMTYIVTQSLT